MTTVANLEAAKQKADLLAQGGNEHRVWFDPATPGTFHVLQFNKLPPTAGCSCVYKGGEGKFRLRDEQRAKRAAAEAAKE